jgi:hypothetical protein
MNEVLEDGELIYGVYGDESDFLRRRRESLFDR